MRKAFPFETATMRGARRTWSLGTGEDGKTRAEATLLYGGGCLPYLRVGIDDGGEITRLVGSIDGEKRLRRLAEAILRALDVTAARKPRPVPGGAAAKGGDDGR